MKPGIDIEPLSPALGAQIRGIDPNEPLDNDAFERIRAAWLAHLVLLFRGQRLTDPALVAFHRALW
jgi:taurine dioxygenase